MTWIIADTELQSRFFLGTAGYPSPVILEQAIQASGSQVVTVGLKRQLGADAANPEGSNAFFRLIKESGAHLLPNTAGCHTADEAITLAQMAREVFDTHWIKLEVIGDTYTLQPDPFELVKAADILVKEGFEVMVYCADDPIQCKMLEEIGCVAVMPLASLIGSGMGIVNPWNLRLIIDNAKVPIIVDAGVGTASDAAIAMELGCDGVLMNTAIAAAGKPVLMASAMRKAVEAGREAFLAGRMPRKFYSADPSSPTQGLIGS